MGLTFSVAFVSLASERKKKIIWVLEKFKGLLLRADVNPEVIVTDKELTLINAVDIVS